MPRPQLSEADRLLLHAFADRLTVALKAKDLTQSALADALGCSQSIVSAWMRRESMPLGQYMMRLPSILQTDGHWLLTGEGQRYRAKGRDSADIVFSRGGAAALGQLEVALVELKREWSAKASPRDLASLTPEQQREVLALWEAAQAAQAAPAPTRAARPVRARTRRK